MSELIDIIKRNRPDLNEKEQQTLYESLGTTLSVSQLAEIYNVTKASVYNWMNTGAVLYMTIGGQRVVTRSAASRVIRNRPGPRRYLTQEQARDIKKSKGRTTDLALKYCVSKSLISLIRKGERYRDI